jgi:hypothetical protein
MAVDTKEFSLILPKPIQLQLMVEVAATVHLILVVDLQHQGHRPINKKNQRSKKFQRIKTLAHLTLVEYNGDKTLRLNQNNKKLLLTKQPTNQLHKTKRMQCLLNHLMVKKEWMKTATMMHLLQLFNRNNRRLHLSIYLIWDLRMLSRRPMDLVIC